MPAAQVEADVAQAHVSGARRARSAFVGHARAELGERLAAQIGDARGGDREVGRLVALAAVRLRRQERAVGLDDEAIGRARSVATVGQRARVRIGHRARERDRGGRGRGSAARSSTSPEKQCMMPPTSATRSSARMASVSAWASRQWMTAGLPTRRARARAGGGTPLLHVARREVAEEVEADLADRHHARRPPRGARSRRRARRRRPSASCGCMPDRRPHVGLALRERDRRRRGLAVRPDRHHAPHAGRARARQHRRRRSVGEARESAGARGVSNSSRRSPEDLLRARGLRPAAPARRAGARPSARCRSTRIRSSTTPRPDARAGRDEARGHRGARRQEAVRADHRSALRGLRQSAVARAADGPARRRFERERRPRHRAQRIELRAGHERVAIRAPRPAARASARASGVRVAGRDRRRPRRCPRRRARWRASPRRARTLAEAGAGEDVIRVHVVAHVLHPVVARHDHRGPIGDAGGRERLPERGDVAVEPRDGVPESRAPRGRPGAG